MKTHRLAVLIPCYNEAPTIGKVVQDFKREFPDSTIYVFDNNSSDGTGKIATEAGARAVHSPIRGKGNVIRQMFADVEADVYIMVDGDDTYPAVAGPKLLDAFYSESADMAIGMRLDKYESKAFRPLHKAGNRFVSWLTSTLFNHKVADVLSGYRVFSRDFVKGVSLRSKRFEIETEMTIRCLSHGYKLIEVPITYGERPAGSVSKLNTYRDGAAIIKAVLLILKTQRPGFFFSILGLVAFSAGLVAGWFPVADYLQSQFVYHVPLAILAAALEITAILCFTIGIILGHTTRLHADTQKMFRMLIKDQVTKSDSSADAD